MTKLRFGGERERMTVNTSFLSLSFTPFTGQFAGILQVTQMGIITKELQKREVTF